MVNGSTITVCTIMQDIHDLPLQSFITTMPKMWLWASFTLIGCPSVFPPPTKNAISNSKSIRRHGPKTGGSSSLGRVWPLGRWMGVPDTTTLEARPWYPTGKYFLEEINERMQFFSGCWYQIFHWLVIISLFLFYFHLGYYVSSVDPPVWHECILLSSKHSANIGGMINGGVEVSVVPNVCWKVHSCPSLWNQCSAKP